MTAADSDRYDWRSQLTRPRLLVGMKVKIGDRFGLPARVIAFGDSSVTLSWVSAGVSYEGNFEHSQTYIGESTQ